MTCRTRLNHAIRYALAGVVAAAFAAPALAANGAANQDNVAAKCQANSNNPDCQSQNLGTISVTGSHIKGSSMSTTQPILRITHQEIEDTGIKNLGELLDQLPSVGFVEGLASGSFYGSGAERVDLRYLGSNRLLVLLNGHRLVSQFGGSADLTQIPTSIIDHIEILQDGASAVYGSDAIAGVINIITKKNINGGSVTAYYGISNGVKSGKWDGQTEHYNATIGKSGDWGDFLFSASYLKGNAIPAGDREFSGINPILKNTRGSVATPEGTYFFYAPTNGDPTKPGTVPAPYTGLTAAECPDAQLTVNKQTYYIPSCALAKTPGTAGTSGADFHRFTNADRYIGGPLEIPITINQNVKNFYTEGSYNLTPSISINASALYNRRQSIGPRDPDLVFWTRSGFDILPGQNGNPFGFELASSKPVQVATAPDGTPIEIPTWQAGYRSTTELGRRIRQFDAQTGRFSGGLNGYFNTGRIVWDWDTNYLYSSYTVNSAEDNLSNNLGLSLSTSPLCPQIAGCVPLRLFGGQGVNGKGSWTKAMVDYVNVSHAIFDIIEKDYRSTQANISTSNLVDLPAGGLGFAVGYQHRNIAGSDTPGQSFREVSRRSSVASTKLAGEYSVDAYYAEVNVPILAHMAGADYLGVDIASRYSDYSTFGSTTNSRVGFKYQPIEDLAIRGSYSQGFRAADLSALFSPRSTGYPYYTDPCSNYDAAGNSAELKQNCKAAGVPGGPNGYVQNQSQTTGIYSGNTNLKPETSVSKALGFVYSPSYLPGFNVSLDYYHIDLTQKIASFGANAILNFCYKQGIQQFCDLVTRTSGGKVGQIDIRDVNIGETKTAGYDLGIGYDLPPTSFGQFRVKLDATHVNFYKDYNPQPDGSVVVTSVVGDLDQGTIPEWKARLNLDYTYGPWHAALIGHYISDFTGSCSDSKDGTAISLTALGFCTWPNEQNNSLSMGHRGSLVYWDLHFAYDTPWNVDLALGINNVTGKLPAGTAQGYGFISELDYGVFSRYYYFQVTAKF